MESDPDSPEEEIEEYEVPDTITLAPAVALVAHPTDLIPDSGFLKLVTDAWSHNQILHHDLTRETHIILDEHYKLDADVGGFAFVFRTFPDGPRCRGHDGNQVVYRIVA
jgi:hypothetical protein